MHSLGVSRTRSHVSAIGSHSIAHARRCISGKHDTDGDAALRISGISVASIIVCTAAGEQHDLSAHSEQRELMSGAGIGCVRDCVTEQRNGGEIGAGTDGGGGENQKPGHDGGGASPLPQSPNTVSLNGGSIGGTDGGWVPFVKLVRFIANDGDDGRDRL